MPRFCTPSTDGSAALVFCLFFGGGPRVQRPPREREEVAPSVESVPSFKWRFLVVLRRRIPPLLVYVKGGEGEYFPLVPAAYRERAPRLVGCLTLPREKDRKLPGHFDLMRRSIWPPLYRRSAETWLRVYGQEFWYFVKRRARGIYYG